MSATRHMDRLTSRHRRTLFGAAIATALTAVAMSAPTAPAAVGPATTPAPLQGEGQYRVELVKFKAVDESGWDRAGSDEPYFIVGSVGTTGSEVTYKSREFSDVDSGESRNFSGSERCVFPRSCGSSTARAGIGVNVQLIEADHGSASAALLKSSEWFKKVGSLESLPSVPGWIGKAGKYMGIATNYIGKWLADDPIDTKAFAWSKADLERRLPNVGNSFTTTTRFGSNSTYASGDADYDVTMRVTLVGRAAPVLSPA